MKYCENCGKEIDSKAEICPKCGVRLTGLHPAKRKSPGLAAFLSFFITGLGQFYNGEFWKGITFFVIQIVNVFLMCFLVGFLTFPLTWLYCVIDAYRSAKRINS